MKVLYIDCFSGISGDMCLAALIDLGLPLGVLQKAADQLGLPLSVKARTVQKHSLRAVQVSIEGLSPQPPHRRYSDLLQILKAGRLPDVIREKVARALERLASAEAAVHGCAPEEVHFHELGGLDTLIDLAGVYQGIAYLGIDRIIVSPLPLGRGEINTAHGLLPLPAPAALHLLQGLPTRGVDLISELVTPTGAVLAATLGDNYGPPPDAVWERIGYGAGRSDLSSQPNILRLLLGHSCENSYPAKRSAGYSSDSVTVIETQIDDSNPELLPYLRERLEEEGALDITFTPTIMKKGRPGILLTVLADRQLLESIAGTIFRESSAIGLRWYQAGRIKLYRQEVQVTTPYGEIPVKIGYRMTEDSQREVLNTAPEYEDCARCAAKNQLPVKEVYQAAAAAARRLLKS